MLSTFEAVAVAVLVVLPGALYTWGFEQSAGPWGTDVSDRMLRFVGGSAVFHALAAPLTWWVMGRHDRIMVWPVPSFWWPLWPVAIGYALTPLLLGRLIGTGARERRPWAAWVAGAGPAPEAWDVVFADGLNCWLRIRLKDSSAGAGGWILGLYEGHQDGGGGYAGGSTSRVPDLYLRQTAVADPATGNFLTGPDGQPTLRDIGVLLRRDDMLYLEVIRK